MLSVKDECLHGRRNGSSREREIDAGYGLGLGAGPPLLPLEKSQRCSGQRRFVPWQRNEWDDSTAPDFLENAEPVQTHDLLGIVF